MTNLSNQNSSCDIKTNNTALILDGALAAKAVVEELKEKIAGFIATGNRPPGLNVILVGNDPCQRSLCQK